MQGGAPSALVREMTDRTVLVELMAAERLTRAEIAARSGLSKPTVAESVRRLADRRLVHDTGERTSTRGGVGSYYALSPTIGVALAVSIAPEGLVAETVATSGATRTRVTESIDRAASARTTSRRLARLAQQAVGDLDRQLVRTAVVSAADPVDRASGALVHLPDAPFLLGPLSPARTLRPHVADSGTVTVDNDVNWAARSERAARLDDTQDDLEDLVYLHLGEGLGCAVVSDGQVRRGHSGLTGEVAHVLTEDPDGRATPFLRVFDHLGLHHAGSTAVDVDLVLAQLGGPEGRRLAEKLGRAVGGVLSAVIALADPSLVVVGGSWGRDRLLLEQVKRHVAALPRSVPIDTARVTHEPALAGARRAARDALRADVFARSVG